MPIGDSRVVQAALVALTAATLLARSAAAQTEIKATLEGPIEGPAAPYFVAVDRGYFQRQGLSVHFDRAVAALEPITRVASGAYQMGVADLSVLMRWRDQNPSGPVKAIFVVYNRAPYAVIARRSRGVSNPKDLEGKRLGAPTASASAAQWPLFAKLNNVDATKVGIEKMALLVRDPMLAAGQIDAVTAFAFRSFIDLKDRGVPANDLVVWRMADYGVQLYGDVIIANTKFANENPKAVSGFLEAFLQGLRYTVKNPADAAASVMQRTDVAKQDVEIERLRMAIRENIVTQEVLQRGYGDVDPERLQAGIDQLNSVGAFKTKPTPAQVFDSSFLPPAADRRVN